MFPWMKSVFNYGMKDLRREFSAREVETPSLASSWSAGLVIDPTEFSRQLVNLHTSMRQANAPATREVAVVHSFARRD